MTIKTATSAQSAAGPMSLGQASVGFLASTTVLTIVMVVLGGL